MTMIFFLVTCFTLLLVTKMGFLLLQAKPETVEKVCDIVRKQLVLPDDSAVTGESTFTTLGADSLDTVLFPFIAVVIDDRFFGISLLLCTMLSMRMLS